MFVDINGNPIDLRAKMAEGARRRYLEGKAAAPKRKPTVKNGYAAPPGTGPEGKTCRDCAHKHTMGAGHAKSWIKCELRRATWTGGEGTDILARSPACSKFEQRAALPTME